MHVQYQVLTLILSCLICQYDGQKFGELFQDMVDAYVSGDWQTCIDIGTHSLSEFRRFQQQDVECRMNCHNELIKEDGDQRDPLLSSYALSLRHITCIQDCKQRNQDESVLLFIQKFESREPYDFLQVCYYKVNIPAANFYKFL